MPRVLESYPWISDRFSLVCEEQNGDYAVCDCPLRAHRQARVRLTLGEDGVLLFMCMRGCNKLEILRAVGASWKDCWPGGVMPESVKQEIVARYPYHDETGKKVLYQTIRLEPGKRGRDKDFRQRRPHPNGRSWVWDLEGVRYVLYRLHEILAAPMESPVFKVAGEKDADNLRALGFVATTNVGGEQSRWLDSYSEALAGRDVIVVQDHDGAGKRHTDEVCGALMGHVRSLRRVLFPGAKDATDFLMKMRLNNVTDPEAMREYILWTIDQYKTWRAA